MIYTKLLMKEGNSQEIPLSTQLLVSGGVESFVEEGRMPRFHSLPTLHLGDQTIHRLIVLVPPLGWDRALRIERINSLRYSYFDHAGDLIGTTMVGMVNDKEKLMLQNRINTLLQPQDSLL